MNSNKSDGHQESQDKSNKEGNESLDKGYNEVNIVDSDAEERDEEEET